MPLDESLAYYWASIGFSAAGVVLFLWLLKPPKAGASREKTEDRKEERGPAP
jgi:hypothetical protein